MPDLTADLAFEPHVISRRKGDPIGTDGDVETVGFAPQVQLDGLIGRIRQIDGEGAAPETPHPGRSQRQCNLESGGNAQRHLSDSAQAILADDLNSQTMVARRLAGRDLDLKAECGRCTSGNWLTVIGIVDDQRTSTHDSDSKSLGRGAVVTNLET